MFLKEEEVGKVLKDGINQRIITRKFFQEKYFRDILTKDFENHFMLTDLKTWLADESLMRTDKMTMAYGLEQRVPVLDHHLVELAMKIPSKYKIKSKKEGKAIFKEAMEEYLPKHVLESAYKKVWLSPMSEWLRTDLKDFAQSVLSPDYCPATKEYFDFQGVNRMFIDHIDKKRYNLNLIWAIITFQIWYRNTIEAG
jgi:asparagine synthase (glutamine-hydrolysing)